LRRLSYFVSGLAGPRSGGFRRGCAGAVHRMVGRPSTCDYYVEPAGDRSAADGRTDITVNMPGAGGGREIWGKACLTADWARGGE